MNETAKDTKISQDEKSQLIKMALKVMSLLISHINQDHLINSGEIIDGTIVALDSKFDALNEYKEMFEALK